MLGGRNYNNKWHYYLSFVDVVAAFNIANRWVIGAPYKECQPRLLRCSAKEDALRWELVFFLSLLSYGL